MSSLLGLRIHRADEVGGVIVNATSDASWRPGSMAFCYDIVWADGTHARKVPPEAFSANGWRLSSERLDRLEYNRIWQEHQVERARQMAAAHVGAARDGGIRRTERHSVGGAPARFNRLPVDGCAQALVVPPPGIPVSAQARHLLAQAWPDVQFAVSLERKRLSLSWIDGPVEVVVEQVVQPLLRKGLIQVINIRRGASHQLVIAAIDHVLSKVWRDENSPGAQADRMRLVPDDFQSSQMATVMTPPSSPIGAISYVSLIRCVVDRWDDGLRQFVEIPRTRHLVHERSHLFPLGDKVESEGFRVRLEQMSQAQQQAHDFVQTLSSHDRERG